MFERPKAGKASQLDDVEAQSFVVRLRADPTSDQARIRTEYVNTAEIAFHASIEASLTWLETRMRAAITPAGPGDAR